MVPRPTHKRFYTIASSLRDKRVLFGSLDARSIPQSCVAGDLM